METNSETMAFRLIPTIKERLKLIAERESRTCANNLKWLTNNYFESRGLYWPSKNTKNGDELNDRGATG